MTAAAGRCRYAARRQMLFAFNDPYSCPRYEKWRTQIGEQQWSLPVELSKRDWQAEHR
jgi:hypothetical protein